MIYLCQVSSFVYIVVTLLFGLFCGCRGFCHRTESDLFLFLFSDGCWTQTGDAHPDTLNFSRIHECFHSHFLNRTFLWRCLCFILPFWHFCWCRGYCYRTESDLFLFVMNYNTCVSMSCTFLSSILSMINFNWFVTFGDIKITCFKFYEQLILRALSTISYDFILLGISFSCNTRFGWWWLNADVCMVYIVNLI